MKIVQIYLCLLMCCGAADGFSDLLVDLGQNVTLDCEISVKHVYWFLMKPSHPIVYILRSFTSTSTDAVYGDQAFRERFSLKHYGSLFIQNITVNELGIYYCMNPDSSQKISNGTRLYITQHSDDHHNQTETNQQLRNEIQHKDEEIRLWKTLFILSGLMMCIMLITVIGFIISHCSGSPNNGLQQNEESGIIKKLYTVMQQNGRRSSTFTVVEFTQLSSVL
ncbi:uncharacterized protein LOC103045084 [Astyanax mexicanus]|uniref:uncharacterized protein LOC103045084 n=1 Tax=Astyanax mexicanus TaxID=7994 RepID=UPI0020CB32D6|nr:uncharacterized protein LOC103045084 [Astyanax mexicanus]